MKVDLMIFSQRSCEPERIATVDLQGLPRKGDRMVCEGPPFGPEPVDFVVEDVYWNVVVQRKGEGEGYPEIFLTLPPEDRSFRRYCTCEDANPTDGDGNCTDCGEQAKGT